MIRVNAGLHKKNRDEFNTVSAASEAVILFHGIKSTPRSLRDLQAYLNQCGFATYAVAVDYDAHGLANNAAHIHTKLNDKLGAYTRVHAVGYSLGAMMLKAYLAQHKPVNFGRAIQISPPNQGSKIIRLFAKNLLRPLIGRSGLEVGHRTHPVWHTHLNHDHVGYELGVIAGDMVRTLRDIFAAVVLPGADDGLVGIDETRHSKMTDHFVVGDNHLGIRKNPLTLAAVMAFIHDGHFDAARMLRDQNKHTGLIGFLKKAVKPSQISAFDRLILPWRWLRKNHARAIDRDMRHRRKDKKPNSECDTH